MGFKDEKLNFLDEPGIVRSPNGRIIETGWPTIPTAKWPLAYQELQKSIDRQVNLEHRLIDAITKDRATQDIFGNISTPLGGRFNLGGEDLVWLVQDHLRSRMSQLPTGATLNVCDVGGGNGFLLERAVINWKNPHATGYALRNQINTTLTTLVNLDPELLANRQIYINNLIVGAAIELPPDNLFARFDVVTAQNSVYFWSRFPELATLNLRKMLKPQGVVFATISLEAVLVELEGFSIRNYLANSPLFKYQELAIKKDRILIRLDPVN